MKTLLPLLCISLHLTQTLARSVLSNDNKCNEGEFYNEDSGRCRPCSECSPELSPCGPLCHMGLLNIKGFSFIQPPEPKPKVDCEKKEDIPEKTPKVMNAVEEERLWRTLAFVLIGIISLLVVTATVLFFISYNGFRNYPGWFCKAVNNDAGDESENGYVVIHRFVPACATPPASPRPAHVEDETEAEPTHVLVKYKQGIRHPNRGYKPKRRLLPESADDVFESDDSGGSRSLGMPLAPIPEKEDC